MIFQKKAGWVIITELFYSRVNSVLFALASIGLPLLDVGIMEARWAYVDIRVMAWNFRSQIALVSELSSLYVTCFAHTLEYKRSDAILATCSWCLWKPLKAELLQHEVCCWLISKLSDIHLDCPLTRYVWWCFLDFELRVCSNDLPRRYIARALMPEACFLVRQDGARTLQGLVFVRRWLVICLVR